MAQSTTNLGKIHVFPSETLYNQFKDIIADNDLALLKDDGAYIVAALLEQNGYVKFSNGLILQWGTVSESQTNDIITAPFPELNPLLNTTRKPQFIATIFTPITKRLSVFYCICGILIAATVVGQLDLVNSFGKADRESYVNRAVVATCISPLQIENRPAGA